MQEDRLKAMWKCRGVMEYLRTRLQNERVPQRKRCDESEAKRWRRKRGTSAAKGREWKAMKCRGAEYLRTLVGSIVP